MDHEYPGAAIATAKQAAWLRYRIRSEGSAAVRNEFLQFIVDALQGSFASLWYCTDGQWIPIAVQSSEDLTQAEIDAMLQEMATPLQLADASRRVVALPFRDSQSAVTAARGSSLAALELAPSKVALAGPVVLFNPEKIQAPLPGMISCVVESEDLSRDDLVALLSVLICAPSQSIGSQSGTEQVAVSSAVAGHSGVKRTSRQIWRKPGRQFGLRMRDWSIAAAGCVLGVLLAMMLIPTEVILPLTGRLQIRNGIEVRPSGVAVIEKVLVENGQRVESGQVLARLRSDALRDERLVLDRSLRESEADYNRLLGELNYLINESKQTDIDTVADRIQREIISSKQAMQALLQRKEQLNQQLEMSESIRATESGIVLLMSPDELNEGNRVTIEDRLFTIVTGENSVVLEMVGDIDHYERLRQAYENAQSAARSIDIEFTLMQPAPQITWTARIAGLGAASENLSDVSERSSGKHFSFDAVPNVDLGVMLDAGAKWGSPVRGQVNCGATSLLKSKLYSLKVED